MDITLSSEDFDPYLVLRFDAPFGESVATDDEAGQETAHTCMEAAANWRLLLTVTSSGPGEDNGKYTLDLNGC